ncbi:MAG: hypothetical protein GF416_03500 [Candidatus Altiarchaeales archaeon]|nr:hypothetical protein [Candidatus Altiarchaeales archaeon]MBD3416184.1 hypothetical protein [Candidatus Altiarchaeales archaeon]
MEDFMKKLALRLLFLALAVASVIAGIYYARENLMFLIFFWGMALTSAIATIYFTK